jgi:hypothetical protein
MQITIADLFQSVVIDAMIPSDVCIRIQVITHHTASIKGRE